MTARMSEGLILQDFYSARGKVATKDLEISALDSDKSIAFIIKQDSKILDSVAYAQFAILHTNNFGQRVVRVVNTCYEVTNDLL